MYFFIVSKPQRHKPTEITKNLFFVAENQQQLAYQYQFTALLRFICFPKKSIKQNVGVIQWTVVSISYKHFITNNKNIPNFQKINEKCNWSRKGIKTPWVFLSCGKQGLVLFSHVSVLSSCFLWLFTSQIVWGICESSVMFAFKISIHFNRYEQNIFASALQSCFSIWVHFVLLIIMTPGCLCL